MGTATNTKLTFRTAAIAAHPTHPAAESARRTIAFWDAMKRATRAGCVDMLCEPVQNAIEKRNSVRTRDLLQQKYDRGED